MKGGIFSKNAIFGGEGLYGPMNQNNTDLVAALWSMSFTRYTTTHSIPGIFLTSLTGPGTIWLSGLPFDRMVRNIIDLNNYRIFPCW